MKEIIPQKYCLRRCFQIMSRYARHNVLPGWICRPPKLDYSCITFMSCTYVQSIFNGYLNLFVLLSVYFVVIWFSFYPNVTTLSSGTCYRKSVCLSSVTFVHTTQPIEIFKNVSTLFSSVPIEWPPCKSLRRSSQVNSSVWSKTQEV